MIRRGLWLERLQPTRLRRPIVWLSGVRRVGKTTLTRMLPDAVYMNCDLPSVTRTLNDPELFLDGQRPGTVLVFDEVHRLQDPSRLLKIAADEYPHVRVLATGSSTLAATRKFRDSLTGRKQSVHLCTDVLIWFLRGRRSARETAEAELAEAVAARNAAEAELTELRAQVRRLRRESGT